MMVQDIQARLTELVQKLTRYYADIVKLKENSDKLKRRYTLYTRAYICTYFVSLCYLNWHGNLTSIYNAT